MAIAVNKVDRLSRAGSLEVLRGAAELGLEGEVFPISARTGEGVGELVAHLAALMPEGPFLFAADERSDQPPRLLAAELIREAAIRRTFQELPHAVEVVVEEWTDSRAANRPQSGPPSAERPKPGDTRLRRASPFRPKPGDTGLRPESPFRPAEEVRIRALIWVESASQKGIVIGAQGRMIEAIGSAARRELQRQLGCRVHLDLSVRVRRDWRGDEGLLDRLGIRLGLVKPRGGGFVVPCAAICKPQTAGAGICACVCAPGGGGVVRKSLRKERTPAKVRIDVMVHIRSIEIN